MGVTEVTNSTKFRRISTFKQTLRDGYNTRGEFDESVEYSESDEFDKNSPNVNIRKNDLKGWVQQKWQIWRKWRIRRNFSGY